MCAVGELESGCDRDYGFIGLSQILGCFLQAEGHAVIIQTQSRVFIDDTVEIVTAVVEKMLQLRSGHSAVAFLKKMTDS